MVGWASDIPSMCKSLHTGKRIKRFFYCCVNVNAKRMYPKGLKPFFSLKSSITIGMFQIYCEEHKCHVKCIMSHRCTVQPALGQSVPFSSNSGVLFKQLTDSRAAQYIAKLSLLQNLYHKISISTINCNITEVFLLKETQSNTKC